MNKTQVKIEDKELDVKKRLNFTFKMITGKIIQVLGGKKDA